MTPIEKGRNLGPVIGGELRELGISTLEQLQQLGWPEAWLRLCMLRPDRNHLMCGYALAGAEMDLDISRLPAGVKAEVREAKPRG